MAFRVLAAGNFPAHRTISEFRQRHLIEFQALFVQLVRIAAEAGVVNLGAVAVDGSKVKANASKRKAMTYERMSQAEKKLEQEIAELLEEAARRDAQQDASYGPENSGDELPKELRRRKQRLAKIKERIDGYIAQGREGKKHQSPPQEPASQRMSEKLRTIQGRAHYSRRKAIVEPVFGWIKEAVGFRRFSLRSLEKVSAEWDLMCTAINLKHLNATVCWL